jgi:HlyD family secretion protein
LQQSQVQAAQAQAEAARVAGLDNQGVLSQEAIEARRSQAASARAAVGSARAAVAAARAEANASRSQLSQVETRLARTSVSAPFAGRVLERNVRAGEVTGGAAQPMFRIARAGLIELDAEVPEAQLARVRPGSSATVQLPSGGTVQGTVRYVDPTIDPQSRLGRARIELPAREDLRLGGFARATIQELVEPTLAVPENAVRFTAEGASVFVVGAQDRRVRRVAVRTGTRGAGFVELLQGPPVGSMVILGGSAFVLDGDVVRPQLVSGPAAAPAPPRTVAAPAAPAGAAPPAQAGGRSQGAAR